MTKEEFAEIIKPLSLLDNPKHREFIRQLLTGNFNRWNESKVKNLSSNTVLCDENCIKKCSCGAELHPQFYCNICDNDE